MLKRTAASRYYTRAGSLTGLESLARDLGHSILPMLQRHGLPISVLSDPDMRVPFAEWSALLEDCAVTWACPNFGLQLGQRQNLNVLGPVGLVARLSRTVGDAWKALERCFAIHSSASSFVLNFDANSVGQMASIAYVPTPHADAGRQIAEMSIAATNNVLAVLIGAARPRLARVTFQHERPPDAKTAQRFFNCPIAYGEPWSALYFERAMLALPTAIHDPAYAPLITAYLEQQRNQSDISFTLLVTQFIAKLLPTGRCTREAVAECLHLHPRTLQRRLSGEGTNFFDLLDNYRRETAFKLVDCRKIPLAQVADVLGYSDQSSFHQAFRRWTGATPKSYARRIKA